MKYTLNGVWVNDSTITEIPSGATLLSDTEWNDRQGIPYTPTQAEIDDAFNAKVDVELRELDLLSIRSLREYIATKPDAPQFIIDHEADAVTRRATRK